VTQSKLHIKNSNILAATVKKKELPGRPGAQDLYTPDITSQRDNITGTSYRVTTNRFNVEPYSVKIVNYFFGLYGCALTSSTAGQYHKSI